MISRIFIERPKLSFVISIVTVIAGVLCLFQVPVAEYPEIAPPQIMVSASYPGASAEVIAETVATVIESEANGIEDMIYFSSQSNNSGSYQLSITFKPGTDTDIAQVNVQNAVSRAEPSLPAEVKALGVQVKKRSSDILGMYAFTTDGTEVSQLELSNYVRIHVKDELARIDGISDVAIWGERNYSMRVWLDPMRMSALKIKPEDVISAIESQNVQAAAGTVGAESSNEYLQLKVNTLGRLKTTEQFGDIVIKVGSKGQLTKLRDIARLELGAENYSNNSRFNGRESVSVAIYRNDDAYSQGIRDAFVKEAGDKGLSIVYQGTFTLDTSSDFSVQLAAAQTAGADLVFLPIYYQPASVIFAQAKAMGYAPTFFGVDGMDGILDMPGFDTTLAEGLVLMTPFCATVESSKSFVDAYVAAYGTTPNQFAADAYDGVYIVKAALEQAGCTADMSNEEICDALVSAITSLKFTGLTGTDMSWNAEGQVSKAPTAYVIKGGEYVLPEA